MKIGTRLLGGFGVVLLLAGVLAVQGIVALSSAKDLIVTLYDEPFMAVSHARSAQTGFNQARAGLEKSLLLQEADARSPLKKLENAMHNVFSDLSVVQERMRNAGTPAADRINRATQAAREWLSTGFMILGPPAAVGNLPTSEAVMAKADEVSKALDEVVEAASAYGFAFRTAANSAVAWSRILLIVIAVITTFAGLLISFGTARSFTRPIHDAVRVSERIAAGDFSEDVKVARRDEFGRLLASLAAMQAALQRDTEFRYESDQQKQQGLALEIKRRESLENEVSRFRDAIDRVQREVNETTQLLDTTAHTLSSIAGQADQKIKEAAGAADDTSAKASVVAHAAEDLSGSFQAVCEKITTTSSAVANANQTAVAAVSTIQGLSEAAKHIENIVDVIQRITAQTNLLALNATIEAARAGEAGRGFSVVATEVKALAMQTGTAAKEISSKILFVANAIAPALEAIKTISSVMSNVHGLTLEMSGTIAQQTLATTEISKNVKGAASATEFVANSISGTAAAVNATRNSASELIAGSERLSAQAQLLRNSVDQFLRNVAA